MSVRIPPVQTLKAFEAAARHRSYTQAAHELSVTHSAISHQIAKLESILDVKLFVRDGQSMALTPDGHKFATRIRAGLSVLEDAFADVSRSSSLTAPQRTTRVVVSVLPGFANRWLVPRLTEFRERHPDIDIELRPSVQLAKLDGRDGVDIAIRYGLSGGSGARATLLTPSWVFPVASEGYIQRLALRAPTDLARATLLRKPGQPWRPWFQAAGLDWDEPGHGPLYDDASMVLDAAALGQGVALGRAMLVEADLRMRRLVRLFDVRIQDAYSWFLVEPDKRCVPSPSVLKFREWLLDAIRVAGVGSD